MKILIILFVLIAGSLRGYTQDLPNGTCGIVFTYDAAGNRIKRVYECKSNARIAARQDSLGNEVVVEGLYPNPTTGKVTIRLADELRNAHLSIYNAEGRLMSNQTNTNAIWYLDLSNYPDGIYYIMIRGDGHRIVKRIVKISGDTTVH